MAKMKDSTHGDSMLLLVERDFKVPRMPNFLREKGKEDEESAMPVAELTYEAAETVAEEMANAFIKHWEAKRKDAGTWAP